MDISDNDSIRFNPLYKNEKYDIILIKTNDLSDEVAKKQMIELLLNANVLQKNS